MDSEGRKHKERMEGGNEEVQDDELENLIDIEGIEDLVFDENGLPIFIGSENIKLPGALYNQMKKHYQPTDDVNGFNIKLKNLQVVKEIFDKFPNAISNLKFGLPQLEDATLNSLGEVCSKLLQEEYCVEDIALIIMGMKDLEVTGVETGFMGPMLDAAKGKIQSKLLAAEEDVRRLQAQLEVAQREVTQLQALLSAAQGE